MSAFYGTPEGDEVAKFSYSSSPTPNVKPVDDDNEEVLWTINRPERPFNETPAVILDTEAAGRLRREAE